MRGAIKLRRSLNARLGGLGVFDLLWRVPEATPGNGTVADAVLGVFSVVIGDIWVLESVTIWVLIGYASFSLAPKAYPGSNFPEENNGFRLLFAAGTIGIIGVLPTQVGGGQFESHPIAGAAVWLTTFGILFAAYLYRLGWRMDPTDERTVGVLGRTVHGRDTAGKRRLGKSWTAHGWKGTVNRGSSWALLGVWAAVPASLAGAVGFVLLVSSPIGELLFLSAIVASAGVRRFSERSYGSPDVVFDLETYLYDSVSHATRSPHGIMLIGCLIVVLLLPLGVLAIALLSFPVIASLGLELLVYGDGAPVSGRDMYILVSAAVGAVTLLLAGSIYASWAALREVPRIAAFVDDRQGKPHRDVSPRPVGFVGPGFLMTPVFLFVVRSLEETVGRGDPPSVTIQLFAVGWPLLLASLGLCWWLTRRRAYTPVRREHHVLLGSALFPVLLGAWSPAVRLSDLFGLIIAFVGIGYWSYVSEYAMRHRPDGIRQHGDIVYAISLGVALWVTARTVGGLGVSVLTAIATLSVGAGVTMAVLRGTEMTANGDGDSENADRAEQPSDSSREDRLDG